MEMNESVFPRPFDPLRDAVDWPTKPIIWADPIDPIAYGESGHATITTTGNTPDNAGRDEHDLAIEFLIFDTFRVDRDVA